MTYHIQLEWKVVTELTPQTVAALHNNSTRLFNLKGGKNFLRSIGGKIRTGYSPTVLEPTDVFHNSLAKLRADQNFLGKKFPYECSVEEVPNRINISLHLYGRVLCATVRLAPLDVNAVANLAKLQKLETHSHISELVRQIIAILQSGNRHSAPLTALPKYYPAIHIVSSTNDPEDWKNQMVSLVTRHALPRDSVVTDMLNKNDPLQVDHSLILIDKQGIVAYVPADAHATISGSLKRFGNATSMLELAAVLRHQLSKGMGLPACAKGIITSADEAIPESVFSQHAWSLITKEFKLQIELEHAGSKPSPSAQMKLLIVTVTSIENKAVQDAFALETGMSARPLVIDNFVYKFLGLVGNFEVYQAISEMGSGGIGGSQTTIRKAIEAIKPDAVFMVGIAFGIDKKKFSIGDIIISKQLLCYDLQRVNFDDTITIRGDRVPASAQLINWVRHATDSWHNEYKVEPGLILSGDKLIDNKDYRDELHKLAPAALGGEMEGAGLYVASQELKKDWILIKAICDWADGRKGKNKDNNQKLAASNAANFVLHVLKSTPV